MSCSTGQIVGLLGRNGSGKSCLLQVVFGTMRGEFNSVLINISALIGNYLEKKVIAYLPQINLLPSFLSFEKAIELYEADWNKIVKPFPELKDCLRGNRQKYLVDNVDFLKYC